jgi:hypothetical protein
MVLYFLLPRITAITYTYREAAGLWWEDRFRPIISTIVNLITNIILVNIIGMNGVIISTLICTIFINVPWGSYVLFKNYFKRSPIEYFRKLLFYIGITFVVGFVTYEICSLLPEEGLVSLCGKGIICIIIPNCLLWVFYHKLKEFSYVKNLLDRLQSKLKGDKRSIWKY